MGKNAEYMLIGYAAMAIVLGAMILWMYWRYWALRQEELNLARLEAEERPDQVASAVGAYEEDALPRQATPGQTGMEQPMSSQPKSMPEKT